MRKQSVIQFEKGTCLESGRVNNAIKKASMWLTKQQKNDGHWAFELEADATIPSEYIFLNHFLGDTNAEIENKLANYLRDIQEDHGGCH